MALIVQEDDQRFLFKPNQVFNSQSSQEGEYDYTIHINNQGYRGRDFSEEKTDGVTRILTIGDSFTFGVGAKEDETFAAFLEAGLLQMGFPVEVINGGVGHISTIRHWDNLLKIHLRYHPDIVFLFFDMTDLWDDWNWERHAVWNKSKDRIKRFDLDFYWGKRDWWATLVHRSALCKYLQDKIVRPFQKLQLLGASGYWKVKQEGKRAKAQIIDSIDEFPDDVIMEYDALLMMRGRVRKDMIDKHWKRTEKYLLKIRNLLAQRGIPFIIVMYPHGIYVGPDQWGEGRQTWGFEEGKRYTDYYPFELMEKFGKEYNVPVSNTLPGFLEAPHEEYFFNWDGHMKPVGNRLVAGQILGNKQFLKLLSK